MGSSTPTEPEQEKGRRVFFERERGIHAIHITRDVAHLRADFFELAAIGGIEANISTVFHIVAKAGVPIFLAKLHLTGVTFACAQKEQDSALTALSAAGYTVNARHDLALVTLCATSLRDLSNVTAEIVDALTGAGARLHEIEDSHNAVQCLIEAHRVPQAVDALTAHFGLSPAAVWETHLDSNTEANEKDAP